VTQAERNRQVHQEILREWRGLSLEERVKRLIASGILTEDGKQLAPRYVAPAGVAPEAQPDDEQSPSGHQPGSPPGRGSRAAKG